jgi:hypothetical protein
MTFFLFNLKKIQVGYRTGAELLFQNEGTKEPGNIRMVQIMNAQAKSCHRTYK